MRTRFALAATTATALFLALALPLTAEIDPDLLSGLKARSIGPAAMSGRIAAITSTAEDTNLVYVGAATGGVWKSVNGGLTWQPVFDDQPVAAVGAVALEPGNPDVVWVGTGEGNPRNSASVGDGVYRSLDGGKTWQHMGLEKTERIHRILIHPDDPKVLWVAALGQMWGENPERGVFKSVDGGKTWRKVLYVDEKTGAADLVADPGNPNKLFAAMWDYRRWPWNFRSGGPGSGIHVSHDGGETWKKLTEEDGLPKGDLGRIGLAVAPSDPRVVYALVEAEKPALLRSDDGGKSFRKVNEQQSVSPRPFYYADIRVDTDNPNRVYRLASRLDSSDDGGKTFQALAPFRAVHPDHHALWVNPKDGRHLINGNDGGVTISHDRGRTWHYVGNLPLPQFYHVRVDNAVPYNVYGGLQDNGSWKGPSTVWENGGIRNHHWQEVHFGDGFDTVPDPRDPMVGYALSQEGYSVRWDLRTGERKDIRPAPPEGAELRFNWNTGIALDPFAPDTLYVGSQFVHKSTDRGDSWTIISPDLTTNKPEWQKQKEAGGLTPDVTGAENFTTIIAIAPSPVQKGVIWVGTDDGRLHVTKDGGADWQSVEGNVRGVPANTWIPHIHASSYDAATAFVVFEDHRRSNWTPYVMKTTDYGKTWTSLATKDLKGYALAIVQDPVDPDLLFLGTEFGLWVSLDGGKAWMKWTHGVPTVSVMDLAIHPREHDLVIATHGRGLYVLDDIRPLRQLSEATQKEALHLFPVADAQQYRVRQTDGSRFPGNGEFRGEIRPYGALVNFSLNVPGLPHPDDEKERERKAAERAKGKPEKPAEEKEDEPGQRGRRGGDRDRPEAEITILDAAGKTVRTFKRAVVQGLNRVAWDLKRDAFKRPFADQQPVDPDVPWLQQGGPEVMPGTYTVRVKYGEQKAETGVKVVADPRFNIPAAARQAKEDALVKVGTLMEAFTTAVERIAGTTKDVDAVTAKVKKIDAEDKAKADKEGREAKPHKDLLDAAKALKKKLEAMSSKLTQPEDPLGIPPETDAGSRLNEVLRSLGSSWDTPTPAQQTYLANAEKQLEEALVEVNRLYAEDVAAFRAKVEEAGIGLLTEDKPIEVR